MNEARRVIESAAVYAERHGHEKRGFLSYERGFLPLHNPLTRLPPAYRAWDELAVNLPRYYRDLNLRQALDALPVLSADAASLPDA